MWCVTGTSHFYNWFTGPFLQPGLSFCSFAAVSANKQIIFNCMKPFSLPRPQVTFYSKFSVPGLQCL